MIYVPFAQNGVRNYIQVERQQGQGEQDATLKGGFPSITMIPESNGGLAPNGEDFNGILHLLSVDTVHRQNGKQIQYNAEYARNIGGYERGAIVQSTSLNKSFISTVDRNFTDPDSQDSYGWSVYAGSGAIKNATSTTVGLVKLADTLASDAQDTALTARQGKILDQGKVSKADLVDNLTSDATWTAPTANQARILAEGLKALSATDQQIVIPNFQGRRYIIKFGTANFTTGKTGAVVLPEPFPEKTVFAMFNDTIVTFNETSATPNIVMGWRQDNTTKAQIGFYSSEAPYLFSYLAIGY